LTQKLFIGYADAGGQGDQVISEFEWRILTQEKNNESDLDRLWLRNESEIRNPQSQIRDHPGRYALCALLASRRAAAEKNPADRIFSYSTSLR